MRASSHSESSKASLNDKPIKLFFLTPKNHRAPQGVAVVAMPESPVIVETECCLIHQSVWYRKWYQALNLDASSEMQDVLVSMVRRRE